MRPLARTVLSPDLALQGFRSLVQVWNETGHAANGSWGQDVARVLARYMERGPDNREYLYNVANWDLRRLQAADHWSGLRKPRIDLRVSVEKGGALILEWAPRTERSLLGSATRRRVCDFLRFDAGRPAGCDSPVNRLMHVPRLGSMVGAAAARMRMPISSAHRCFQAAAALIESHASGLGASFDVKFLSKLVVADRLPPDGDHTALAEIVDLAARDKKAAEERLVAWSRGALKPYAIELRQFLHLARECGGDIEKLAGGLRGLTAKPLSTRRVRRWVSGLEASLAVSTRV